MSIKAETKNKNSLLYGNYDEQESHEAFKQALEEWRNGSNNSNNNKTAAAKFIKNKLSTNNQNNNNNNNNNSMNRDAFIGDDEPIESYRGDQTDRVKLGFKNLNEKLSVNNDLTYADRLLLQKLRRESNTSSPLDSFRAADSKSNNKFSSSSSHMINHFSRQSNSLESKSVSDSDSSFCETKQDLGKNGRKDES